MTDIRRLLDLIDARQAAGDTFTTTSSIMDEFGWSEDYARGLLLQLVRDREPVLAIRFMAECIHEECGDVFELVPYHGGSTTRRCRMCLRWVHLAPENIYVEYVFRERRIREGDASAPPSRTPEPHSQRREDSASRLPAEVQAAREAGRWNLRGSTITALVAAGATLLGALIATERGCCVAHNDPPPASRQDLPDDE